MKTLVLNGSPRRNGNTAALISELCRWLEGEVNLFDCCDDGISPCTDCRYCRTADRCCVDDRMQSVYEYLTECDNVVIASPVYFSELSGRLLDAASRFQLYYSARYFRNSKPCLKEKRGGVLLVCGGTTGPEKAYDTASLILRQINVRSIYKAVCSSHTDVLSAADDEQTIKEVKELACFLNGEA